MKQIDITKPSELMATLKEANIEMEQIELRDSDGTFLGMFYPGSKGRNIERFLNAYQDMIDKAGGQEAWDARWSRYSAPEDKDPADMTVDELIGYRKRQRKAEAKARLEARPQDEYSVAEAAAVLGKTSATIYQAISRGKITTVKRDGKHLISQGELKRYLGHSRV